MIDELRGVTDVIDDERAVAERSRDWWPLAMHWSLAGEVPARAAVAVRPSIGRGGRGRRADLRRATACRSPPPAAAAASAARPSPSSAGSCSTSPRSPASATSTPRPASSRCSPGHSAPTWRTSCRLLTGCPCGHFPQSFDIATVGGWVACRGAGQYSTRYGKIEELVVGLEVVLADGGVVRTGGAPAGAVGPDLTQLFTGSEGTLGVITRVWLRAHPLPLAERRAAWTFASFADGIEACRTVLRSGATPAVLRLYDAVESARGHGGDGARCTLLVLDEGEPAIVDGTMAVVAAACAGAEPAGDELVAAWLDHRNDTSALQALTRKGFVVDTMEIAAPWSRLAHLFDAVREALMGVPHARVASCHLSHSYRDGACLYFTFAATPPADEVEATYIALWDAGQRAVLANGGNLSHHHGVGLNRARFIGEALGDAHRVLVSVKAALDPEGILNPGKLGLPSPFGDVPWPAAVPPSARP